VTGLLVKAMTYICETDLYAMRMADEGIPLHAISRVLKIPAGLIRDVLHQAIDEGRILAMPREDWPPLVARAQRSGSAPTSELDEEGLIALCARTFHLTRLHSRLLLRFVRRGHCTKDMVHDTVEDNRGNPDEPTLKKNVDVHICNMRKRLRPFGLSIHTIYGIGYTMPNEARDAALAVLAKEIPSCVKGPFATTPAFSLGIDTETRS
jgi:hypothetical protein